MFSRKSYLTSVISDEGLKDRIKGSDVLLLLSPNVDPSKYKSIAKQNSILTIVLGTNEVVRKDVNVSIARTEKEGIRIHVNWKRFENSDHDLSYKILNLAKVHR